MDKTEHIREWLKWHEIQMMLIFKIPQIITTQITYLPIIIVPNKHI